METKLLEELLKYYGLPTVVIIVFILYFLKLYFPAQSAAHIAQLKTLIDGFNAIKEDFKKEIKEQRQLTVDSVSSVTSLHKDALRETIDHNEKMFKQIADHNVSIHSMYAQRIDGVVTEMRDFKKEISGRIELIVSHMEKAK